VKKAKNIAKKSSSKRSSGIRGVVSSIEKKLRESLIVVDGDDIAHDPFSCCLKAAISKCLDFNKSAHSHRKLDGEGYLFVSGMRGMCEDLIVLRFLAQIEDERRKEFLNALIQKNFSDGIAAQSKFFKANNSLQPVVGADISEQEIGARVVASNDRLRGACKQMDFDRIPSVAKMARTVGLIATYEFIYFLTSNFVHFNPQALMRMGWGTVAEVEGNKRLSNVKFSTSHMGGYYRNLSKFYGTILLVGFVHLLKGIPNFAAIDLTAELNQIDSAIAALDRWPEAVTFEEMNIRPPLFFLVRAFREVMKSDDIPIGYGQILEELKLGTELPNR
jgi:hypothetical protein